MATIVNWVFILGTKLLLAYIRGQLQRALCIIPEDLRCLLCLKYYMNYPSNLIMESYLDTYVVVLPYLADVCEILMVIVLLYGNI